MVCIPKSKTVVQKNFNKYMKSWIFFHLDEIETRLHQNIEPDVRCSIHGPDQAGIVANATDVLDKSEMNILNL